MNRHQRLTAVLDLLSERGSITVEEAMADLGVSPATVRRDLDQLAQQQLLTRTRGGAVAATVSYDLPLRYKAGRQAPEKERIAQAVVGLLAPGSVVGLNGGTTTTNVARAIALHEGFHNGDQGAGITVVTNALNIANELVVRPHVKLVVVGGVVRARSYELIGPLAARLLDAVTIDTAVIGVDGISAETGATAYDEGEAAINALLAGRAERVVVAADSRKVGRRAFARILPLDQVDVLVTDTGISDEAVQGFEQAGVKVVRA